MSLSKADAFQDVTSGECLDVTVEVIKDSFTASPLWIGIAFLLGFLLGVLIAVLITRLCLHAWMSKMAPKDEKEQLAISLRDYKRIQDEGAQTAIWQPHVATANIVQDEKNKKRNKNRPGKQTEDSIFNEKEVQDLYRTCSFADVLQTTDITSAQTEILNQDIAAIDRCQAGLQAHTSQAFLSLLSIHLNKMKAKQKVTEKFCDNFLRKVEMQIDQIKQKNRIDKNRELKDIQNDNKYTKQPDQLLRAKNSLDVKYDNLLAECLHSHREGINRELSKSSGLTDSEVEILMEKLLDDVSSFEDKMMDERSRQMQLHEERMVKQQALVARKQATDQHVVDDVVASQLTISSVLDTVKTDGKLNNKKCQQIVDQHNQNLQKKQEIWDSERERYHKDLAMKLQKQRDKKMLSLSQKHKQEVSLLTRDVTDKSVSTDDFITGFSELIRRQLYELHTVQENLDTQEAHEFYNTSPNLLESWKTSLKQQDSQLSNSLSSTNQITQSEADRIMSLYKKQLESIQMKKEQDRQDYHASLMDRLKEKRKKRDEEKKLLFAEQVSLKARQDDVVRHAVMSCRDLDEECRQKIFDENEKSMKKLTQQLEFSRIRQEKILEKRLNEKRLIVSQLKQKVNQLDGLSNQDTQKQHLEKKINEEEHLLKKERQIEVERLRQTMAAETEALLRQQEQKLTVLIGKLQVGEARRQAVVMRQNQKLQELQSQLEKRVMEDGRLPTSEADHLIEVHYNQISHLNQHLQRTREQQESVLQQRILNRKTENQRKIESDMDKNKQLEIFRDKGETTKSFAMAVFSKLLLERKQANILSQLENDTKLEMERQRDELNRNLQNEMEAELQKQKQDFLSQLAALGNLSKGEINSVLDLSAKGGDIEENKKFAKKLKLSMRKAKKNLLNEDDKTPSGMDNPAYDASLDDETSDYRSMSRNSTQHAFPLERPHSHSKSSKQKHQNKFLKRQNNLVDDYNEL